MRRLRPGPLLLLTLPLALAYAVGLAGQEEADAPESIRLGEGAHTYEWTSGWLQAPEGADLGNTHGNIAIDAQGLIYLNTDTEQAVMVFRPDGGFVKSWGKELAGGLHGMVLVQEGQREYLLLAHTGRHEVLKTTLDGEVLWRIGWPEEARIYSKPEEYRPTSAVQAPDGRLYVADGYGKSYIHVYDSEQRYVKSIGGPGSAPGRLRTPHGLFIDTYGAAPVLMVADRENNRLQTFDLEGQHLGVVHGMLRRPCTVQRQGNALVVADLAGRVTVLSTEGELVCHLGDQPEPALRARNKIGRASWQDGLFLAPHSAVWDDEGNLYVMDWNSLGRVTKLRRMPAQGE